MTEAIEHPDVALPPAAPNGRPVGWLRANVHFLIAASILALAAAGWFTAIQSRLIFPLKHPVPWAAFEITVDGQTRLWKQEISEDARWTNLATEFGPFRLLREGDLPKSETNAKKDARTDGEIVYGEEVLSALGIPSSLGEKQLAARTSNWYVSRIYLDQRKAEVKTSAPYALWHLDVTYYTGSVDLVPHTPEACLLAGGRQIVGSPVEVRFDVSVPERWKKWWDGRIAFTRITSVLPSTGSRSVDYYAFCLNGRPETSRYAVRRTLTYPWVPHCYFAKIQFAPRTNADIADPKEADRAAEEFVRYFLPEVLKGMPTPDDVEKLRLTK